jgi:hypothetical protein
MILAVYPPAIAAIFLIWRNYGAKGKPFSLI